MPTGYTDRIKDDTTLREFALACARNFGALILMRDEPSDAPIPDEFKPSSTYAEWLSNAEARLAELQSMTPEQAQAHCRADYEKALAGAQERREEMAATKARYQRMLALVNAWTPPSPDHEGLKKFMREQIESSIEFDCYEVTDPQPRVWTEWLAEQAEYARRDVATNRDENRKEIERTASRNRWVRELRDSLK